MEIAITHYSFACKFYRHHMAFLYESQNLAVVRCIQTRLINTNQFFLHVSLFAFPKKQLCKGETLARKGQRETFERRLEGHQILSRCFLFTSF